MGFGLGRGCERGEERVSLSVDGHCARVSQSGAKLAVAELSRLVFGHSVCKNDIVRERNASMSLVTEGVVQTGTQPPHTVPERVLIVEDDAAARVGLEQLLKSWGFVAESAVDGEDALEKVTSFRPAIVISDLIMPRMDGLALL